MAELGLQKGELGMDCSDRDKNLYSVVFDVAKTNGEQFQMVPWLPVAEPGLQKADKL